MLTVLLMAGTLGFGAVGPVTATVENLRYSNDEDQQLLASPEYSDISDAGGHRANVEALAERGILQGTECAPEQFCPKEPIQRWVMAVWLVRAVDETEPAGPESSRFEDVARSEWWFPYVERLADLGITRGCTTEPALFCPTDPVTRQQMASFLVRAFQLQPELSNKFTDVEEGNSHLAAINGLAASGITRGCATEPDRFCPTQDTTRAQMATFIARALGVATTPPKEASFTTIAAGDSHTCGLRSDGTVVCWGQNGQGQADPVEGKYIALAAGGQHTCTIGADQTITCWGANWAEETKPSEGLFSSVTASWTHSCALHTNGAVACWGFNESGQINKPVGTFTALASGDLHSCGLRTNGAVKCWGQNGSGQANAPSGEFISISAGGSHSCGVRIDSRVSCWGASGSGQADPPTDNFRAVTTGTHHSCGILESGSVTCWGSNDFGEANPPQREFTAIAAGNEHTCGLSTNGTVTCWGKEYQKLTTPRDSYFTTITAGATHGCGLQSGGTVTCWGSNDFGEANPPRREFTAIAAGRDHSCGIGLNRTIVCWGSNLAGETDPPQGEFTAVTAGHQYSCGLRSDRTISCWGTDYLGQSSPPPGTFTALEGGEAHTCGLRTDQTITCWGANLDGQIDTPEGRFAHIATGGSHSCGIRTDQTITCWGANLEGQIDAPPLKFTAIAAGRSHSCGLDAQGIAVCWGANQSGQSDPPEEQLTALTAGDSFSCGLRNSGALACWGQELVLQEPPGVGYFLHADPTMCRPAGPAGLYLPRWSAPSVGTLRVAVIFMDFPDAPAGHTTQEEADLGLPFIEEYLKAMSYGKIEIEFLPLHRWLRAEHPFTSYSEAAADSGAALNAEAIRLADPEVDFTGYHTLMIVMPSSHFRDGTAGGLVRTEEGVLLPTTRINTLPLDRPEGPYQWGLTGAHELVHNLGLLDLYSLDPALRRNPQPADGKRWVNNQFGLMGLWANFMALEGDPRLAHIWVHPDGHRTTAYDYNLQAVEMLAWSRWQLGWLDPTQVRCLQDDTDVTITLDPIAIGGALNLMVAIPLSEAELIVIESRRRVGYDHSEGYVAPDGVLTSFPALVNEGVLVYTVNAVLGNGERPLRVISYPGNAHAEDNPLHFNEAPILREGQSVTYGGYTVTVQHSYHYADVVTITKSGKP